MRCDKLCLSGGLCREKKDSSKYLVAYTCHGVGFGDLETARGTEGELTSVCLSFVWLAVIAKRRSGGEARQRRQQPAHGRHLLCYLTNYVVKVRKVIYALGCQVDPFASFPPSFVPFSAGADEEEEQPRPPCPIHPPASRSISLLTSLPKLCYQ